MSESCCCYHKGTYFQANHNVPAVRGVAGVCCCCYHKGTYFQANHNTTIYAIAPYLVVVATTKVRIFKQITTSRLIKATLLKLLLLPQRYVFSSKSQLRFLPYHCIEGCCCYHKGTYFQANHNCFIGFRPGCLVVVATTKVRIFKQITTRRRW